MRYKYYTIVILAFLFSMLMMPVTQHADKIIEDVNGDGKVNIADVNLVIGYILKSENVSAIDLSKTYLSAKDFGAVGDGVTDDTDALEALFETAFLLKKPVLFDSGTYVIRRSLPLRSGMEIYGEDATIKKKDAMVAALAEPATAGQAYIDLTSVSGLEVGDQFLIADTAGAANQSTYGIITGIDGNRVSFTNVISNQQSSFTGCVKSYAVGTKVSNSFALLRSWSSCFECDGVSIHDLTLDGNRRNSEPRVWASSCIHLDSYYPGGYTGNTGIEYRNIQRDLVVRNVLIKNSPCDGISDQGQGGLIVRDCVIENPAMHGIHLGTKYSSAVIADNKITGNGTVGAGVFFCQGVNDVIVVNNEISCFSHGCSDEEDGTAVRSVTIRNNVFDRISGNVFNFMKATAGFHGICLQISENKISNLNSYLFSGDYLDNVMLCGNAVKSVTAQASILFKVTRSRNVVIVGNTVPPSVSWNNPVVTTETVNLIQDGNSWNN